MLASWEIGDSYTYLPSRSAGLKKVFSATAVADNARSQALYVKPDYDSLVPVFGIGISQLHLQNISGGAASVGMAVSYGTRYWGAGQVTAAGVFTDDTTDAQDVGVDDFPLHDSTDSGSGFIVHCDDRFNLVSVLISTAGDQTTPVLVLEYWNGTSWATHTDALYISEELNSVTGERVIAFALPSDWVKGGSGAGVRQDRYNAKILQTHSGAGTTDPLASMLFVGLVNYIQLALVSNTYHSLSFRRDERFPLVGEALFPLFGVADLQNTASAQVRIYSRYD